MAIKIALKGQFFPGEMSATDYAFPKSDSSWATQLEADPGKVMQSLSISGADKDCYTILVTSGGVIYAYRKLLPRRGDCAMVMLMADGPAKNGKQLIEKLKDFLQYGLNAGSSSKIDDNIIAEKLSSTFIGDLFYQYRRPMVSNDMGDGSVKKEAYRTYVSDDELYRILESPYQPAYGAYRCIHVVSESHSPILSMGSTMERIQAPLKKIYFFKLPSNVTVKGDKQYVSEDDSFTLQYSRNGYKTEENFIPTPFYTCKFFKTEGDTIVVNSAEECNLHFKRAVTITIRNKQGNPVNNWSYRIKGSDTPWRQQNGDTATIELNDGEDIISIKAEGCDPAEITLSKNTSNYTKVLESNGITKSVYFVPVNVGKKDDETHQPAVTVTSKTADTPLFKNFAEDFNKPSSPTLYVMRKSPLPLILWIGILALLLGLGLGTVVGHFVWPTEKAQPIDHTTTPGKTGGTNPATGSAQQPIQRPTIDSTQLEKEDENYLSANYTWVYDSLKSEKYKELYNKLIMNGHEELSDGNNVTGWWNKSKHSGKFYIDPETIDPETYKIDNAQWKKIATAIRCKDTNKAKKYRDKLILCITGSIDLKKVVAETQGQAQKQTNSSSGGTKVVP